MGNKGYVDSNTRYRGRLPASLCHTRQKVTPEPKSMNTLDTIAITWHVDDILDRAKEYSPQLSWEQAQEVLGNIERYHDACIGINWEVVDTHIELFLDHLKRLESVSA